MNSRLKNRLIYTLVVILVAYLSIEIFVRQHLLKQGFSYIQVHTDRFPHFSLVSTYSDKEITIKNSRREKTDRRPKKARVAFVGDSETFGVGVPDNDVFTEVLESNQNVYNAFNYGVPGYGISEIRVVINQLLKQERFDLVVYKYNINDIFPTMPGMLPLMTAPEHRFSTLEEFQGFYGIVKLFVKDHLKAIYAVPHLLKAAATTLSKPGHTDRTLTALGVHSTDKRLSIGSSVCYSPLLEVTESIPYQEFYALVATMYSNPNLQHRLQKFFADLKSMVESANSSLLLLIHHDVYLLAHPKSTIPPDLRAVLDRSSVSYLDLAPVYAPKQKDCGFFFDTTHLGYLGHRHLGDFLTSRLGAYLPR